MKSFIKRGLLIFLVLILCGCSSVSTNMSINKDKQVSISYIIGLDNSYLGNKTFQEIFSSKTINDIRNNGYTVSEYSDNDIYGYKITMNIDNIDTISDSYDKEINILELLNNNIENELYIFKREDGFLKNKYSANFIVDMSNILEEYKSFLVNENYLGSVSYKFTLSLPYEVESSNATSISDDKKTLIWNYSNIYGNTSKINFTFSLYNKQMVYLVYIFIGVVILIIINIIVRIIIAIEDFFKRLSKRRFERAQRRMEKKILKQERKEQDRMLKAQLNDVKKDNKEIVKDIFNDLDKKSNSDIQKNIINQNIMEQSINKNVVNNNIINQNINNQGNNKEKEENSLYIKRNVVKDYIDNLKNKVKGIFKKKDKNEKYEENNTDDKNIM